MAKKVYMPVLGMNQDTGTLLRWFKQQGESVVEGEPLMEVATDKTEVEIEAPASGLLSAVTAQAGDEPPTESTTTPEPTPGPRSATCVSAPADSRTRSTPTGGPVDWWGTIRTARSTSWSSVRSCTACATPTPPPCGTRRRDSGWSPSI